MGNRVRDAPVSVAHEEQIEVIHSVIVLLMEEVVPGGAGPRVEYPREECQQIALEVHREDRENQCQDKQPVDVELKYTPVSTRTCQRDALLILTFVKNLFPSNCLICFSARLFKVM